MAKAPTIEALMNPSEFVAGTAHTGVPCYFCPDPIEVGQKVRYYGGPYIMHSACVQKAIDPDGLHPNESD